jgi:ubiquinone/menaquinone biosynthesis C-methylase UbiE
MTHSHFYSHRMPDDARRKWHDPEAILYKIGLKPGDKFIDIGCGYGFFAIPAAKIVGEKGKVFGVDIYAEAIKELKETAAREGLSNLELVVGEAEKTVFCKACADIVFFGIDLHDFADPFTVLQNAREMLKPVGKVIDLDWKKIQMEFGPPFEKRFSEEQAKRLIESSGFIVETIEDVRPYNYLIIARPV